MKEILVGNLLFRLLDIDMHLLMDNIIYSRLLN